MFMTDTVLIVPSCEEETTTHLETIHKDRLTAHSRLCSIVIQSCFVITKHDESDENVKAMETEKLK